LYCIVLLCLPPSCSAGVQHCLQGEDDQARPLHGQARKRRHILWWQHHSHRLLLLFISSLESSSFHFHSCSFSLFKLKLCDLHFPHLTVTFSHKNETKEELIGQTDKFQVQGIVLTSADARDIADVVCFYWSIIHHSSILN